ncbi:helix-turn-helix transcriptional regulator [Cohnella fermenti]|uniref:WYL domain-containing protein n=1 Tax=Cohnella fermenti TaxID=2565925 RepID=A0A4S4BIP3_9BACL|nr:WYL domain-containing protein [Cohnella fermenti]THF74499.1 WYL domain-containing protein [Cohnella fermenti]
MRADRLLTILLVLQSNGRATVRELARQLEVSERTVQRDMEALCMSGIPLTAERGAGGGWSLPEGYRTRLTGLTSAEIQALLVLQTSSVVRELALGGASGSALAKLLSALPVAQRSEAELIRQRLHIDMQGWHEPRASAPLLPIVQQAVWEGRKLRIRYGSPVDNNRDDKREKERIVCPWGLVAKLNTWYFVAGPDSLESSSGDGPGENSRAGEEGAPPYVEELRTYRVSRLLEAECLEERFEAPAGFDLADWWERSTARFKESLPWLPAVVRIKGESWKRFSEERYVRVGSVLPEADGWRNAHVEFHTLDSARELLLGYGDSAVALAPAELADAIRQTAANLVRLYGSVDPERRGEAT